MATHDNLAALENLSEERLVQELRTRYNARQMYTYVGDILVALNPYEDLGIYTHQYMSKYSQCSRGMLPPHVFAVADAAYSSVVQTRRSQVCIVSGESGAGKTETTKFLIRHVLSRCSGHHGNLHEKINQMSPVLESFGNAQTVMNHNSSRFGKYMEITFDNHGVVNGGLLSDYLLERSRVVNHGTGERNFHVFYYFCAGVAQATREALAVAPSTSYRYLCMNRAPMDTRVMANNWTELLEALNTVGFDPTHVDNITTLLASVLHIGNLELVENDNDEAAIRNPDLAAHLAQLMVVDANVLIAGLTTKTNTFRNEVITKTLNAKQGEDHAQATSKAIYGNLFKWLVERINKILMPASGSKTYDASIGLLDIFGFENFEHNSFEQACINLANEKLQHYFNDHVFRQEIEELKLEGLSMASMPYNDNQTIIDMFTAKPLSLFHLLDEESYLQSSTPRSFGTKLNTHLGKQACLRVGADEFTVEHYAGKVSYRLSQFINKNRDELPQLINDMLSNSRHALLRIFFREEGAGGGPGRGPSGGGVSRGGMSRKSRRSVRPGRMKKKKVPTVGAVFRQSLDRLMEKMSPCEPHFVRCIKPNRQAAAQTWDEALVMEQLKYTGMLETVRIRREGFAVRLGFAEFFNRYFGLVFKYTAKPPSTAVNTEQILQQLNIPAGWQMGRNKVFLKYYHADALLQKLNHQADAATKVQAWLRCVLCRRLYRRLVTVSRAEQESASCFVVDVAAAGFKFAHTLQVTAEEDARRFEENRRAALEADKLRERQLAIEEEDVVSPMNDGRPTLGGGIVQRMSVKFTSQQLLPDAKLSVPEIGTKAHERHAKKMEKQSIRWLKSQRHKIKATERKSSKSDVAPWFHGLIKRDVAEKELFDSPTGTYLIRISESRLGYSLSLVHDGVFKHYKIVENSDCSYRIENCRPTFTTLQRLIDHYKDNDISTLGDRLLLPLGVRPPKVDPKAHEEIQYVELVWDEKTAKRVLKPTDNGVKSPVRATGGGGGGGGDDGEDANDGVRTFISDAVRLDKMQVINNNTIMNIDKRFGTRQHTAGRMYLPATVAPPDAAPLKQLRRTHTQVMKQRDMIADAERRILAARTSWRKAQERDKVKVKRDRKQEKRVKQAIKDYDKGKKQEDKRNHDYRSLVGVLKEMELLRP